MKKTNKEILGDRCYHYSDVEDGFYCWKCLEKLEKEIKQDE